MIWQCLGERLSGAAVLALRERARSIAAVVLAITVAAGCAGMGWVTKESSPEAKRAAVTERVNARWAALIKGDMDTAYTFFSPASRQLLSIGTYKQQARGSGFRKAEITSVDCDAETCRVDVMVTLDHRLMAGLQSPQQETWVLENGQYWYTWKN